MKQLFVLKSQHRNDATKDKNINRLSVIKPEEKGCVGRERNLIDDKFQNLEEFLEMKLVIAQRKLVCERISATSSRSLTGSPADSPADFRFLFQTQCTVLRKTTCRTC